MQNSLHRTLLAMIVVFAGMSLSNDAFSLFSKESEGEPSKEVRFYNGKEYVAGELIVKLAPKERISSLDRLFASVGQVQIGKISDSPTLLLMKTEKNRSLKEILQTLRSDHHIEYAEPNYIYKIDLLSPSPLQLTNDPDFANNWALQNSGQILNGVTCAAGSDIDAVRAWDITTGNRSIVVGVIDTGVDANHPDLKENIWHNSAEIPDNGIDDDGNGFIDDDTGWNFYGNNKNSFDDNGHGTHVSGTIGAVGNNGIGTVGVNWQVSILPVKFLGADGSGTTDGAIQAIDYAVKMGAHILNNSWGGGGFSQALADKIALAESKNVLFVAAAGNDSSNNDNYPHYPSNYPHSNVISVAATDCRDQLAYFSNYGLGSVDISAPGVAIYSTLPNNTYGSYSGTSMATPHIAGAAALLWSLNPSLTMGEVIQRLLISSDEILTTRRKVASSGRLDMFAALAGVIAPRTPDVDPSTWTLVSQSISTPHNYQNNYTQSWTLQHPGAKTMAVHFTNFNTEAGYDKVTLTDATGIIYDTLDGILGEIWSLPIKGDTIIVTFRSDSSIIAYGFDIDQYAAQPEEGQGGSGTCPQELGAECH
ncbi:MAG: S8 family serine peptidase [Deltaproteobacteria bacterium]|nr:S8 family serine peptidase [Deltaproteobacteria bacterium]